MKIEEFFDSYEIKRNPIQLYSPYENRMIDPEAYDEYGEVEEELDNYPIANRWTLVENKGKFKIIPGIGSRNAIGYFISSKPWNDKNLQIEIE